MRLVERNVVHFGGHRHHDGAQITVKEGFGCRDVEAFRRLRGWMAPQEGWMCHEVRWWDELRCCGGLSARTQCPFPPVSSQPCTCRLLRYSLDTTTTHTPAKIVCTPSNPLDSQILPPGMLFACPECNRKCKSLSGLTRHRNSVHQNDPRLSIPVTELQRIYHANLNGTYNAFGVTLSYSLQASAVIDMEYVFRQTPHQKFRPSRRTTIGRLSCLGLVSNSRNSCIPMPNFHREGLTRFSNCGPPRSSPTTTLHPSPTTVIFISRLTQSSSVAFHGRIPVSSTMAPSPKRPAVQSG